MRTSRHIANMSSPTPSDPWPLPELTRARRAIVVVDVVESVRVMQEDEAGFIERWRRLVQHVRTELLPKHGGRLVKSLGDGMLLEFEAVPQAVAAALGMQQYCDNCAPLAGGAIRLCLRIGVHVADVVVDELDIYGSGVNLAARLTSLAQPGQTVVSDDARALLVADVDAAVEDLGECFVKHLDQPLRAYRIGAADAAAPRLATDAADLRPGIAVVPLRMDGSAPAELAALGEVIADRVIAALARSPMLRVLSRLSTSAVAGRDDAASTLATHARADYTLSGRFGVRSGQALHVAWTLADGATGSVVWSDEADTTLGDLLDGDSRTLIDALAAVGASILREQMRLSVAQGLPSLPGYTLLMAAIGTMHRVGNWAQFERARHMLEYLTERHPRHPSAYAWLGKWHVLRMAQGWSPDPAEEARLAMAPVRRALHLDPTDALALTIEGQAVGFLLKDLDGARALHDEALAHNPNEPLAWLHRTNVQAWCGEGEQALHSARRASDLSPLDPLRFYFDSLACAAALCAQDYPLAIELGQRSLKANRLHASTLRCLAMAQLLGGDGDAARTTAQAMLRLEPGYTVSRFISRYPGSERPHGARYARALHEAGIPA
jgi:adenylate cyclase